jgi:hypothetical protein
LRWRATSPWSGTSTSFLRHAEALAAKAVRAATAGRGHQDVKDQAAIPEVGTMREIEEVFEDLR